jgi:hypothetical protein
MGFNYNLVNGVTFGRPIANYTSFTIWWRSKTFAVASGAASGVYRNATLATPAGSGLALVSTTETR